MEINARLEETPVSDLFGLDYCLHIVSKYCVGERCT
jgi:hypothetical protein